MNDVQPIRMFGIFDKGKKRHQAGSVWDKEKIAPTLDTMMGGYREPLIIERPIQVAQLYGTEKEPNPSGGRVYSTNGIMRTLGVGSGMSQPIILEDYYVSEKGVKFICDSKRGMATDINPDIAQPLTAKGQNNWTGTFISPNIDHLEKSKTLGSTKPTKIVLKNGETMTQNDDISRLRIRKLTPKECWRLMGFDDEDVDKCIAIGISNSQLYKQAGNSIVVSVLEGIFRNLYEERIS